MAAQDTPDAAERRARARVAARGHDIVTTGHVIEWPASGCARMTERETRTHIPGEPDEADRDVLSLADALRAAEARAVAAEAERDAADARHAALAGAVRAEREARDAREAALRSERVARVADASADMAGWQVAHDRYTSARVAHERASTHLTALLCAAPCAWRRLRAWRSRRAAAAAEAAFAATCARVPWRVAAVLDGGPLVLLAGDDALRAWWVVEGRAKYPGLAAMERRTEERR